MPAFDEEALLEAARAVRVCAYAPYSGFTVGAALLAEDGTVFAGCNVENAAYPTTLCAERAAIGTAVAAGARRFTAVAVVAGGGGPCWPCGMCRQVLSEFAPDLLVLSAGSDGVVVRRTLSTQLLPDVFGPDRLEA